MRHQRQTEPGTRSAGGRTSKKNPRHTGHVGASPWSPARIRYPARRQLRCESDCRSCGPCEPPRAERHHSFGGDQKLYVRGVTYGTFRPGPDGADYPEPEVVERDFAEITRSGINAVRTYTVPPRWLLDLAQAYGLRVMVGLPWEQHIAFLDE